MIRAAYRIKQDLEQKEKETLEKSIKSELERIESVVELDISKGRRFGEIQVRCADYPAVGEKIKIELKNSGYSIEQKEVTNKLNDKAVITYAKWSLE